MLAPPISTVGTMQLERFWRKGRTGVSSEKVIAYIIVTRKRFGTDGRKEKIEYEAYSRT